MTNNYELVLISMLRDEDLQRLFFQHLQPSEIVEDVSRLTYESLRAAGSSDMGLIKLELSKRCRTPQITQDILTELNSVPVPILATAGKRSFETIVGKLEAYVRWRKFATHAEQMSSQDFTSVYPNHERYDRCIEAAKFRIDPTAGDGTFRFSEEDDFLRAMELASCGGKAVPSTCALITESLDDDGYTPGSVNLVVAPPGVTKSTFLCSEAVAFIKNGLNVLHYTIGDLSAFDVWKKYTANYLKTNLNHVKIHAAELNADKRVKDMFSHQVSRVVGAYSLTVDDIHDDAMRVRDMDKFDYQVIIVDYDGNIKSAKSDSMYLDGGYTYGILEKLSRETNSIVLSASQPKIDFWNKEIIPLEAAAESSKKQHAIDTMITFSNPNKQIPVGMVHLPKVRRGITGLSRHVLYLNGYATVVELKADKRKEIESWYKENDATAYDRVVSWAVAERGFHKSVIKNAA